MGDVQNDRKDLGDFGTLQSHGHLVFFSSHFSIGLVIFSGYLFDIFEMKTSCPRKKLLISWLQHSWQVKIRGHRVELSLVEATLISEDLTQEVAENQRDAGPIGPIFKEACCCVLEDVGI